VKRVPVVLLCLVTASLLPHAPARAEAGVDDEYELLRLINNDRSANGVGTLRMDGRLQEDARRWSVHLLRVQPEHDPNMPWYDCSLRSENVAWGQKTVGEIHRVFMESPSHRANILRSNVNAAGIGVYYDNGGYMYTVQRFYNCPSIAPAHWTGGAIKSKWLALGAQPMLGRFTGGPTNICGGGQFQNFGGGADSGIPSSAIYWHPQVDGGKAHVIFGGVWGKYSSIGYQCGVLGWPTTDTLNINYCRGQRGPIAQGFQNGLIQYSPATGAHALVSGPISARFGATGGHCGPAGLPTSDQYDWPGAESTWRVQTFEFRYIAEHKPTAKAYICTYQGACS
jgi:hypothetical protein